MKPTKLILTFSFVWCLALWCSGALVLCAYAADLDVESGGKLKSDTFTFDEQASAPAHKASGGGRVYYDDDNRLYISDGAVWNDIEDAKTVATRIVGVDKGTPGVVDAGDSNLVGKTADYICDGTADNVEIQQAIDDLGSNGGVVYLLEGTYNISSPVVFNNTVLDSNKALIGAGAGTLLQTYDSPVITASNVSGILISQLKINGLGDLSIVIGVSFSAVTASKIDKVWITNTGGSAIAFASSSNNNAIINNHLYNNVRGGTGGSINLASSNNNIISSNNIQRGTSGILLSASSNNTISNNNIQRNDDGIYVYNNSQSNTISNNNIQDSNGTSDANGIRIMGSTNNIISSNNIQGNNDYGILIENRAHYTTISGNNIQGNDQGDDKGIYIVTSSNNTVTGNIVYDTRATSDGIKITGTATYPSDNNIISSNYISAPSETYSLGYGINIVGSDCNNNYLVTNYIDDNNGQAFTAKISDSGTNTKYTGKDKITLERQIENITTSTYTLDIATNPRSYVVLNPTVAVTALILANGKSAGDLLILENDSINLVTINEASNVDLLGASGRILGQYDTLKLIWNGDPTTPKWIEVAFSDN